MYAARDSHISIYESVVKQKPTQKVWKTAHQMSHKGSLSGKQGLFSGTGVYTYSRVVFHPPKVFSMDPGLSGGCSTAAMRGSQWSSVSSVYFTVWLHVRVASVVLFDCFDQDSFCASLWTVTVRGFDPWTDQTVRALFSVFVYLVK